METIVSVLKFISSYPLWAKLLVLIGLGIVVVTLVFAPREVESDAPKPPKPLGPTKGDSIFMKIKAIQLFPTDPEAEVRVTAYVNGTEFVHPSVGGVQWMRVGPSMSEKIIPLPKADRYEISFEMTFRSEKKLSGGTKSLQVRSGFQKAKSQMVTPVSTLPFSEDYRLYLVNDGSRAASVKAIIPYEIYRQ